jgi:nucleoside-diphosphate-sugar epimerase
MKCIITGAAGFIGQAIVNRLSQQNQEISALLHHAQPSQKKENVTYINGDITNISTLTPLIKDAEVIIHCAAYVKDYGPQHLFHKINVQGTQNLVHACSKKKLSRFIYLSHIQYEIEKPTSYYSTTKAQAEAFLKEQYQKNQLPLVILRPGNVFGPGATTWVLRLLQAIQYNRIALIDHGTGLFLHTYIDNLLDAVQSAMQKPKAVGETIDITDGDNTTTWGTYLNHLAQMAGKPPIQRNLSKSQARVIAKLMVLRYTLFRMEPWVTPMAVNVFTNQHTVSIDNAQKLLDYSPKIDYDAAVHRIEQWLKQEGYIKKMK